MKTWIALFRGINVGGNNVLPMAELKRELEELKLRNVKTYIQSGNVVFDSAAKSTAPLANKIGQRIEQRFGFRPHLLVLGREDLLAAMEANPFPQAVATPKTLSFFFLAEPATDADLDSLAQVKKPSEDYRLTDRVFYLHAPDGFAKSKLAANAEKYLGVVATARNYRTVDKLIAMVTA